ncbi:MAG TPA: 16S rRNA (cytosine(967)-C(5))-methyltransferase RsmB [Vicinamibacterales bacterium]
MISPARLAAYNAILAVGTGRTDLPAALARARTNLTDERDRALAGEIATGTLRWQGAIDHLIVAFAGRPIARLDPEIVAILRLGAFQLLHLDRVPASAVVDDGVQLAKRAGKTSAAGFVNALLRRISRERNRLPFPKEPPIDLLSITLSHPRWLAERWLTRYGVEAAVAWAEFNNSPAPLTLRANILKTSRDDLAVSLGHMGVETQPARFAPDALVVISGNPLSTPLAHSGAFVVQDEASQLVGLFAAATGGERILDACASPGGKTTQMVAAMGDVGLVVAADVRGRRVELLARTIAASGARSVRILRADARGPAPFRTRFDAVLVDAPCSGLGTIRRDPDVRWRRTEADLAPLAAAQQEMLMHLAPAIRPGGRLIYSTCSSEPEENQDVVDAFLAGHPDFSRRVPPTFERENLRVLLDADGALETLPFRDALESFYAASLHRAGGRGGFC